MQLCERVSHAAVASRQNAADRNIGPLGFAQIIEDGKAFGIGFFCGRQITLGRIGEAASEVGVEIARLNADGLIIVFDCAIEFLVGVVDAGAIVVSLVIAGIDFNRLAVVSDGVIKIMLGRVSATTAVIGAAAFFGSNWIARS